MATNPNPARITDELWRFRTACLALEPGSNDQDSGIYANKPGYHNTRAQNAADNYSVRDAPDKLGPSDKAAAWDWTFVSAQNGDYSRISLYGGRMLAAFNAKDPRCNVLREFLGQTDMDSTPEGLDFRYFTKRTPDDTHKWHIHWSFVRAYVAVTGALDCVLSILRGESLADYLARGGKLYEIDGTGEIDMALTTQEHTWLENLYVGMFSGGPSCGTQVPAVGAYSKPGNSLFQKLEYLCVELDKVSAKLAEGGSGGGTDPTPGDVQELQDAVDAIKKDTEALISSTKAGAAVLA
jgi:hypothetical protein